MVHYKWKVLFNDWLTTEHTRQNNKAMAQRQCKCTRHNVNGKTPFKSKQQQRSFKYLLTLKHIPPFLDPGPDLPASPEPDYLKRSSSIWSSAWSSRAPSPSAARFPSQTSRPLLLGLSWRQNCTNKPGDQPFLINNNNRSLFQQTFFHDDCFYRLPSV